MGPKISAPTETPEQRALREQAERDRITAIRERLSDESRDLFRRFGSGGGGGGGGFLGALGNIGVFQRTRASPFGGL